MFTEEIYENALLLYGGENEQLLTFCQAAEREFTMRLRAGITPEMCRETLITASAMLAVSMLCCVKSGTDDVVSYKAGDVEVRRGENGKSGGELRRQAEMLMYPYINDGGFCFMGVES